MFFARFEDTVEQTETTTKQRLEALKQKIAAKQKQPTKDVAELSDVVSSNGTKKHPKKRRKVSGSGENEAVKPKRKKKKVTEDDSIQQECSRKEGEDIETITGESEESEPKKKRKKKKKKHDIEMADKDNEVSLDISKPQEMINSVVDTLNEKPESGDVADNETSPKKKKKKKKKERGVKVLEKVVGKETSSEVVSEKVCEEMNGAVETDYPETTEENTVESKVEEETEETNVEKEEEEEWTVLGRHKTLQKVKHVKRDLPDWIVNCEIVDPEFENVCTLADFGLLDQSLVDILASMEINALFPVQSQIIPDILSGCQKTTLLTRHLTPPTDICVSAPTGSGKTLVYVLSLVQCLYKLPPMLQAIVVVPTKNLANQVKQVFNNFNKLIKVVLLSGKDTFPTEQKNMFTEQGSCLAHVAVTTPGRLVNHLRDTNLFTLQNLRFLVIDEMDTLLNQTYQDWLPSLFKTVYNPNPNRHPMQPVMRTRRYTPNTTLSVSQLSDPALPLQKLLFSATVTHDPSKLAPLQLYKPRLYSCGGKYTLPSTLVQNQIRCQLEDKALVLIHLVNKLKHVLCFASSVDTSHRLAILTEEFGGIKVAEYSSTLSVQQRNKVMRDFSLGNIQLLVCSDSLARGMDISLVDHVINYDVPAHVQTYVHRVGRTARAGKVGYAYTLVRYEEIRHFHQLLKKAGNTRASEMKISDDSIAELSENYQDCLQRLEIRLKSKGKK